VTVVAVSKTVAAERLVDAVAAGITILGENRVQEAEAKVPRVPGATWHLVGPLQSNKARRALEMFDTIETVHSVELAERLDRQAPAGERQSVLLQVNVDRDPAKSGFLPDDLAGAVEGLDACERLDFRGLMTVGRLVEDPELARPAFVGLRALGERLRAAWPRLGAELSMGMSDDFEVAVEEGATIVRVGRALFGERPPG
jgi:pyridoxal phosphate enzyme (YggS family)